jgi:serine/threonine-protein kinase
VGVVLAGRYRIVRRLGSGGMGAVYLGEHLRFGRLDAIKVLWDTMAREPEAAERFLRGARNASAIQHENVCTVYDFGDAEGGIQFLAMEYVEGETLDDALQRAGPLAPERALAVARQVASALAAAHEIGIVHRDLKPGNVMLTRARDGGERVKVVDFDIAKGSAEGEAREVTRMGFVVGTPEYMSPEQLMGDPLDGRSDLYSLGIVLFRMLTGALPSRATTTQDLMVERLTADPLRLADVAPGRPFPPGTQALLDRLLQRRREDRYASAAAFAAAVDGLLAPTASGVAPSPAAVATDRAPAGLAPTRLAESTTGAAPASERDPARVVPAPALIAGLAVLALLGFVGVRALIDRMSNPDGEIATTVSDPGTRTTAPGAAPDGGAEAGDDAGGVGTGDRRGADTSGAAAGGARSATDPAGGGGATDPRPERDAGGGRTGGSEAALPALALADVPDVTWRLFDRTGEGAQPAALRAAADTALLVWTLPGAAAVDRARAAHVLGIVRSELGDTADAVRWLTRAVELDPENEGYRTLLDLLTGGGAP